MTESRHRSAITPVVQALIWLADWSSCVVLARAHHPTLAIDAVATACLLAACAVAVYANGLVLVPRLMRRGRVGAYLAALVGTTLASATAGVIVIQVVYDAMWGPDPLRYGFAFNLATDWLAVALHVAAAMGLAMLSRRVFPNRSPAPCRRGKPRSP